MTVKMKWCKFQTVDNFERELHFEIYDYFGLNICPWWWWGRRQWCRWLDDIMRGVWRTKEQQPVMLFMNLQVYLGKLSSLDTAVSTLFCWQLCLSLEGLVGIYGGHYVRFCGKRGVWETKTHSLVWSICTPFKFSDSRCFFGGSLPKKKMRGKKLNGNMVRGSRRTAWLVRGKPELLKLLLHCVNIELSVDASLLSEMATTNSC